MSFVADEIASQPSCWGTAAELAHDPAVAAALPEPGERVAVVGCGTSLYMAQACAALRESAGAGETPLISVAPAIANAVYKVTGSRVREMPMKVPKAV